MNENNPKTTHWQPIEEAHLPTLPDGTQIVTDGSELLTKEEGRWWQTNGIVANTKKIKRVLIIPEE